MSLTPQQCCPSRRRRDRPRTVLTRVSAAELDPRGGTSTAASLPFRLGGPSLTGARTMAEEADRGGGIKQTFRISLFRTLQICWMSAALWETPSSELPLRTSSSFWAVETATSTPDCMMTLRTIFSPMKFLGSLESARYTSLPRVTNCLVPLIVLFLSLSLSLAGTLVLRAGGCGARRTGSQPRTGRSPCSSRR